ncbi:MAG: hypothetical protein IJR70_01300 [Eubacterium sp.]|nr:hypothetical protein [Eubacterium sp.]
MKRKILISVLAICLMLSPVTSFAQGEKPNEKFHSPKIEYSDSLYELNETADEAKVTFEYRKKSRKSKEIFPKSDAKRLI